MLLYGVFQLIFVF